MQRKIDIAFVDIDWTIFDHSNGNHVFDFESIEALNKLHEQGVKIVICTARAYHSVEQIGILNYLKVDGMIINNGGLIVFDNQIIYQNRISEEKLNAFCEMTLNLGLNVEIIEPFTCSLIKELDQNVLNLFATYQEDMPVVKDYHGQKPVSLLLFAPEEYDDFYLKNLPEGMQYFRFHPYGVDIVEKEHLKGDAVKFVLNYLRIPKEKSISFGDDIPDISMFKETGMSFCLINGKEEAKEAASEVIPEVFNHGVRITLEKYFL